MSLNTGILTGVGVEIDARLPEGWKAGSAPHFSHKSTYLALLETGINQSVDFSGLIRGIDACIRCNFDGRKRKSPSGKNWRFEARPKISPKNKSPEVCLERAIVRLQKRKEWANQSPVASGVISDTSDKGRHVDLVREIERNSIYELIELKWDANNPFFAAMEILCYGLVYLIYREKFLASEKQPLLKANTIRLRVLAPSAYYLSNIPNTKQTLLNLESNISDAIKVFAEKVDVKMNFQFCEIPKGVSNSRLEKIAEYIGSVGRANQLPSISK